MLDIKITAVLGCALLGCSSNSGSPSAEEVETTADENSEQVSSDTGAGDDVSESDASESDDSDTGSDSGEPDGTNVLIHATTPSDDPVFVRLTTNSGIYDTNGAGFAHAQNLEVDALTGRVDGAGVASAAFAIDLSADISILHELELMPLGTPIPFDIADGGLLEAGGVSVEVPPSALVDQFGEAVTGIAEATLVGVDPTVSDFAGLPGPLEGTNIEQEAVSLLSAGMAEISFWQEGRRLQLAPGMTARVILTISPELADAYEIGDQVPAWWLDLDQGTWQEDGLGVVTAVEGDPDARQWQADVSHFTWWQIAFPMNVTTQMGCYVVTLTDANGTALPNRGFSTLAAIKSSHPLQTYFGGYFKDLGTSSISTQDIGANCVMAPLGSAPILKVRLSDLEIFAQSLPEASTAASCGGGFCTPVTVKLPIDAADAVCATNTFKNCTYPPEHQSKVGTGYCVAGTDYCLGHKWTGCEGEVLPKPTELCSTPGDDNCNGLNQSQEFGPDCVCTANSAPQACYPGTPESLGVPPCMEGIRQCQNIGNEGWEWGPCVGAQVPTTDSCEMPDGIDQDCNGVPDCVGLPGWVTGYESTGKVTGEAIAAFKGPHPEPLVYVAGTVSGTMTPQLQAYPDGNRDILLVKSKDDGSGTLQWAEVIGGQGLDMAHAVAVDSSGYVYVAGKVSSAVEVCNKNLQWNGGSDIFVAKFGANKSCQWATSFGASGDDSGLAIAVGNGGVYVAGESTGQAFSEQIVPASMIGAGLDAFLLKLDAASGNPLWGKVLGTLGADSGYAVAVDTNGNVLTAGHFSGTASFGGAPLQSQGQADVYVAKFTSSGEHVWSVRRGGFGDDTAYGIAVDASGAVYTVGTYASPGEIGVPVMPAPLPPSNFGSKDMFLMKFNADGTYVRALTWYDEFGDSAYSVAVDNGGSVIMTGAFNGTIAFEEGEPATAPNNNSDIVLLKLSSNLDVMWAQTYGGLYADSGKSVTVARNSMLNDIFLTGHFRGEVMIGQTNLSGDAGEPSAFIAKFGP